MFCTKCGKKLEDSQRECPYCGNSAGKNNLIKKSILQCIKGNWEKFFATALVVIGIIIVVCVFFGNNEDKYIEGVKQGYPEMFPDISYEDAFDQYFSSGEWSYKEQDDEEHIVEFKGILKDNSGEKTKIVIQFEVEEDEKCFEVYRMYMDGMKIPAETSSLYIWSIFDEYDE